MSPWRYPRLGLPMIGAALAAVGHDVRIYCPQLAPCDWSDVSTADLVGLSTTTSTAPAAYLMARALRERGTPVVIGGSHVTFMADEALEHADFVARGEGGDQLMLELVDAMRGTRDLASIAGLSFVRDGRPVHNALRPPVKDLDTAPIPDLTLVAGHERMRSTPILTSLGCPFGCTFCSVTAMFGRRYRFRSTENVVDEIEQKRPSHIFFYDDNFAADRARLKRLLRRMIARGVAVPWQAQVRTDAARDEELLELMRLSRCETLGLGLESVDQATLDALHKSQSVADIEAAVDAIHRHGIRVHGMFVFGADTDDEHTMRRTVDFAISHGIDTVMLNVLTPAPGTGWFDEVDGEGRIFEKRWQFYDGQHVVLTPLHMEPAALQAAVLEGYARFYSTGRWARCLIERRWLTLRDHTWCWWFARRWAKDRRNAAYLRHLDGVAVGASRPA
ncbi:MAG: B12-binding domain-containing radical SAM protein [Actinobacteria bacterium]|nr:B12-binding domain-containing radical SAM protein [Actinomycetota bacterium]